MATYSFTLVTQGWLTGYAGSLFYTVEDQDGTDRIARTQAAIASVGGGVYEAVVTLNTAWDSVLKVTWDDGTDFAREVIRNIAPASIDVSAPGYFAQVAPPTAAQNAAAILNADNEDFDTAGTVGANIAEGGTGGGGNVTITEQDVVISDD